MAVFGHPHHPRFPTHRHARGGYELFAATPFGLADFGSGYRRVGGAALAASERAAFRCRVR